MNYSKKISIRLFISFIFLLINFKLFSMDKSEFDFSLSIQSKIWFPNGEEYCAEEDLEIPLFSMESLPDNIYYSELGSINHPRLRVNRENGVYEFILGENFIIESFQSPLMHGMGSMYESHNRISLVPALQRTPKLYDFFRWILDKRHTLFTQMFDGDYYNTMDKLFDYIHRASVDFFNGVICEDKYILGPGHDIENRKYWAPFGVEGSTFTDPKNHNPNRFQYIVHSLSRPEEFFNTINVFPNYLYSTSLINERHTNTWLGQWGLILDVPMENIYAAEAGDGGTFNTSILLGKLALSEQLTYLNSKRGIATPEQVIVPKKWSDLEDHNEIAVLGHGDNKQPIRIAGIFKKSERNLEDVIGEKNWILVKELITRLNLPVVTIGEPNDKEISSKFEHVQRLLGELENRRVELTEESYQFQFNFLNEKRENYEKDLFKRL